MGMSGYVLDEMEKMEEAALEKAFNEKIGEGWNKHYALDWAQDNWHDFLEDKDKHWFE